MLSVVLVVLVLSSPVVVPVSSPLLVLVFVLVVGSPVVSTLVVPGSPVVLVPGAAVVVGLPEVVTSQPELVPLETSASLVESPTG